MEGVQADSDARGPAHLTLAPADFAQAFGEPLTEYVVGQIRQRDLRCRRLTPAERDDALLRIVNALVSDELVRSGPERLPQWEDGWGDHVAAIKSPFSIDSIIPKYFGKYRLLRWLGDFVTPVSAEFEYGCFATVQDWLFDKYLRDASSIYELGCGTGHNLVRARSVNARAELWGLDWTQASSNVIDRLGEVGAIDRLRGHRFDMFSPDREFRLAPSSAVYTAASLEQLGDRFEPLLAYLIDNSPSICVHIEPIAELLEPANLLDATSIRYFRKRNYLDGFLTRLRELESLGKIRIHLARRTYVGSLFIEGYSAVVWSPIVENVG